MSTARPEKILRDLAELWAALGKEKDGEGVLRACTMTLLVLADDADDPTPIWETLAALMPEHPSRAVLVRAGRGAAREVSARVFAQCWLPAGRGRQICCEQIEIAATEAGLPDLAGVVLPLAAPDLPVVVWCRSRRLAAAPDLRVLAEGARKVIIDSSGLGDAPDSLRAVLRLRDAGLPAADLAWTRCTRWRELIAQAFDDPPVRERLAPAQEVRIGFAGEAPPPEAFYMAAWLLGGVRAAAGDARWNFERHTGPAGLHSVSLRGAGLDVSVAAAETGCAEVRAAGKARRAAMAPSPVHVLLAAEIRLPRADPHFEKTLPLAARLGVSSST